MWVTIGMIVLGGIIALVWAATLVSSMMTQLAPYLNS